MNAQWYFFTPNRGLTATGAAPGGSRPFLQVTDRLAQKTIRLHRSFAAWGLSQRSPGLVIPRRIWLGDDDTVIFRFEGGTRPKLQSAVGAHAGLAAWLVLLNKYVETSALLAQAQEVWSTEDLAGALAFVTPAFLPGSLLSLQPNNWERLARQLSAIVATGSTEMRTR